ncbi:hypothetical protein MMC28_007561 [Mycoblastus sanguinarius]|nr:hypothetical protein [Mycoblastus sanguinarius]
MASSDWRREIRRSRHHDRSEDSSGINPSFFSSWASGHHGLSAERANQELAHMHGLPTWNQSTKLHCDFISFLAVSQWRELDILSITWQPALKKIGRGATAHIHQSQINPQTSFAFKRITSSTFESDEHSIFRALISEVLVLGHPVIQGHANIVKLMGICWDVAGNGDGEYTVWPVLVYEKANYGDLGQFMESEAGKALSFEQRLE